MDRTIETPLVKDAFELRGFKAHKGSDTPLRFDLDLVSESRSLPVNRILGHRATLRVELADGTRRCVNGLISRLVCTGADGHLTHYRAELLPLASVLMSLLAPGKVQTPRADGVPMRAAA